MKRIVMLAVTIMCLCIGISVNAEGECMKISMNGEVKIAKDIASGKGISFTLPELDDDKFFIKAIELAVFEKGENDKNWHIYTDDDGEETKKFMFDEPKYLNFQVDFGEISDYRDKCRYKIAYRYHVQSIDDLSKIEIAGSDVKDGWRLIGESDGTKATDTGFTFYKNSAPTISVEGFSFYVHHFEGLKLKECSVSDLNSVRMPLDAFENGVKVKCSADDYDAEDDVVVTYEIKDENTEAQITNGILSGDNNIFADIQREDIKIRFTVTDGFGALSKSDWIEIHLDLEPAEITSMFDDQGRWIKGLNLFSDFYIDDDSGNPMSDGIVYVMVYQNDSLKYQSELNKVKNGVYRLDKTMTADGIYNIHIKIYDSSGNESIDYLTEKLDNTLPTATVQTSSNNASATDYSTWMNVSKKIIINAADAHSGVANGIIYLNGAMDFNTAPASARPTYTIQRSVTTSKTGKLKYEFVVRDGSRVLNKANNSVDNNSTGNELKINKEVWLDKTAPTVSVNHNEEDWMECPYSVSVSYNDYPSTSNVADASGVRYKQYALTNSEEPPENWLTYTKPIEITSGGIYYLHVRAVDYAGNETTTVRIIRLNQKSQITTDVVPTDGYKHTIYYSENKFYVVKNTAYNTKYHFGIYDADTDDTIRADVKLVSKDDEKITASTYAVVMPTGEVNRDVVFNMQYLDSSKAKLPDGVYDMYLSITEIKNDDEAVITHKNIKACEVVIKRNAPPTPVISVSSGYVSIDYPKEPLSGSLNSSVIRSHYKFQYKAVKSGEAQSNIYLDYTDKFKTDDMTVTALYTDIAGNTSVATKKVFKNDGSGGGGGDGSGITEDGNNTVVEESRSANVYYIGIRRDKQKGINADIFKFIN